MHIILVIMVLSFSIVKGDWKNWQTYYPTMLYISLGSFLYEFIAHSNFHLWEFRESFVAHNLMNIHFMHNLIINPLVAFVFLSNYPNRQKEQIIYMLKWIMIFLFVEWISKYFEILSYHNGWNFGWSALFVIIMFPMVRLHHVRTFRALLLSILFAVFFLGVFEYI